MCRYPVQMVLETAVTHAESPCKESSLPSAGFCLSRACAPCRASDMFTTHRADPSWT